MVTKRFSPDQRAVAVARATSGDETKREVARDVGVSETTLYRWIEAAQEAPSNVSPLRAVPTAPSEPQVPQTIAEAAESGDYRATLVQLRKRLARQLDDAGTPPRDMAALSRRFLEVVRELQALDSSSGDDDIGKAAATDDDDWDASAI